MTYDIRYRQVDIPMLDSFLAAYMEVCRQHGMQLCVEDYDYDGGGYMTVETFDGHAPHLNLDEAAGPVFDAARQAAEKIREQEEVAAKEADKKAVAVTAPGDPVALLAEALPHIWSDQAVDLNRRIRATLKAAGK